jgi:hypothetical protein
MCNDLLLANRNMHIKVWQLSGLLQPKHTSLIMYKNNVTIGKNVPLRFGKLYYLAK